MPAVQGCLGVKFGFNRLADNLGLLSKSTFCNRPSITLSITSNWLFSAKGLKCRKIKPEPNKGNAKYRHTITVISVFGDE